MRKNVVAGNWKMNTTLEEGVELANQINSLLKGKTVNCDVVVCVPFTHLTSVNAVLESELVSLVQRIVQSMRKVHTLARSARLWLNRQVQLT